MLNEPIYDIFGGSIGIGRFSSVVTNYQDKGDDLTLSAFELWFQGKKEIQIDKDQQIGSPINKNSEGL